MSAWFYLIKYFLYQYYKLPVHKMMYRSYRYMKRQFMITLILTKNHMLLRFSLLFNFKVHSSSTRCVNVCIPFQQILKLLECS